MPRRNRLKAFGTAAVGAAPSGKPISIDYKTANGTAVAPGDYVALPTTTLTFAPGVTTQPVVVTVNGDFLNEAAETFTLDLSNPVNVVAGVNGTGTITNDDPQPTVSVANLSLAEGNVGTTTAPLTVSLSAPSGQTITVDYATAVGTADATDYTGVSGTLTFAPGVTTQTVNVAISGDTTYETDETFSFVLSSPSNVLLGATPATVTVQNDDPKPQISIDDQSVTEGNAGTATMTFTVSLTNPSASPISVDYATNNGTASSPLDYTGVSGTLNFGPGVTTKTVNVTVNGDLLNEADETFTVDLSNPSLGATIADNQGTGTILDDDVVQPTVDVNNVSVADGNAGTVPATFTVSLSAPSGQTVTIDYKTTNGTAVAPGDYVDA